MNTSLREAMARATDEELFDILHLNRDEYSPDAIAVAEEVLNSRNLASAYLDELQSRVDRKKEKHTAPLSFHMKLLLFVCGLTCFGVPLVLLLEVGYRGADRKYLEAWRCVGYGLAVALAAIIVLVGLSLGRVQE